MSHARLSVRRSCWAALCTAALLAGCGDITSLLDGGQSKLEARREAEGRAVGSACRYAGRALEECYERNKKVAKAAILAGWRDMDGYMRENSIQPVPPSSAVEEEHSEDADAAPDKAEKTEAKAAHEPGGEKTGAEPKPAPGKAKAPPPKDR